MSDDPLEANNKGKKRFLFLILGAMLEDLCQRETSCSLSLKKGCNFKLQSRKLVSLESL